MKVFLLASLATLSLAAGGACSKPAVSPAHSSSPPPSLPAGQATPEPWVGLRLPAPPPLLSVVRPVNLKALLASIPRSRCAPREVSPGNWVGLDCGPTSPIARASWFQKPKSLIGAPLPLSVDHRASGMEGPVKDQGAVGACTALSLSSAMEHELRRLGHGEPVSALHIWSQYGVGSMGVAGEAAIDKRLAAEGAWRYDPATACKLSRDDDDSCGGAYGVMPNSASRDLQVTGEKSRADAAGRFPLVGIERVNGDPEELASILAGGSDLWVAFNYNDAWEAHNLRDGVIADYAVGADVGHAVVLAGYRSTGFGRQFLVHNSWGPQWGQNGYAWISESMVRRQMRYAYRVRIGDPNGPPGALPTPAPPPGARPGSGCPAGQAVDLIYRQCMPACAGGLPAAAGLCAPVLPGLPVAPGLLTLPGLPPLELPQLPASQCPTGQGPDVMSGKCAPLCAGGLAPIGGLCLPHVP